MEIANATQLQNIYCTLPQHISDAQWEYFNDFAWWCEGIGLVEFINQHPNLIDKLSIVEGLNASNRPNENIRTENMLKKFNYFTTGGSDAHIVSSLGNCMTYFKETISSEKDLVQALKNGEFQAVTIAETI